MTTAREIRELVRPLLNRNTDLVLIDRNFLYIRPIGHVARQILIDRTGRATCFAVEWHLTEFFMPDTGAWDSLGRCKDRISRSEGFYGGSGWYWTDPTIKDDFITRVETDALAVLRPLDTTRKSLEFARTHAPSDGYLGPKWFLIAAIALGELDEAREIWAGMGRYYRRGVPSDWDHAPTFHRYRMLDEPLMADDRAALAAILKGWAAQNVKGSPLEPYWEPSPLPLEESTASSTDTSGDPGAAAL